MNFTKIEKIIREEFDILDNALEQCKDVSTTEKNTKYYEYRRKIIDCKYNMLQKLLDKYYDHKGVMKNETYYIL